MCTSWSVVSDYAMWSTHNSTETYAKKLYGECIFHRIPATLFNGLTIVADFTGYNDTEADNDNR